MVTPAQGALIISLGNFSLAPDLADQKVVLMVQNTTGSAVEVGGIQFNIQVENGPIITDVDILGGTDVATQTVFKIDNTGVTGGFVTPSKQELFTLENTTVGGIPQIAGNSVEPVATITFSTAGVFSGDYVVSLTTAAGPTQYLASLGVPGEIPTLNPGLLTIVPEPSSVLLIMTSYLALIGRRRRTTRH